MRVVALAITLALVAGWPADARADDASDEGGSAPARPEALDAVPVAPEVPSPRARLAAAVRDYQLGQWEEARRSLTDIVLDAALDDEALRQEARVYLGELLYTRGDDEGARRFFEQVLRQDPTYAIDHFRHPPDVCGFFDYVRAYMTPIAEPDPPPLVLNPPALPLTAWMPIGGIYHLTQGRTGRGMVYLSSEIVLLAGSAGLYIAMAPASARTYPEGDEDARRRLLTMKYAQIGVTGAYWAVWATSWFDASRHWRVKVVPTLMQQQEAAASALPPIGARVAFDTRF